MTLARPSPPYDVLLGVAKEDNCLVCGRRKVTVYWQRGQDVTASYSWVEGHGMLHSECAALVREGRLQARLFEEVA